MRRLCPGCYASAIMPLDTYLSWKAQKMDIGCAFARVMAVKPDGYGQRAEIVSGRDPVIVSTAIATQVAAFIAEPDAKACALVFPDLECLQDIVAVAIELGRLPGWIVTRTLLAATPGGDAVAFNITREVPMGTSTCRSEALILGPFDDFPNTRRSPVTAMELFVGSASLLDVNGKPRTKAHLADVPFQAFPGHKQVNDKSIKSMLEETGRARLKSLGGKEDQRAKAKVSFAIPVSLAETLGCMP